MAHPLVVHVANPKPGARKDVDHEYKCCSCLDVTHYRLHEEGLLHESVLQNLLYELQRLHNSRQHQELEEFERDEDVILLGVNMLLHCISIGFEAVQHFVE